MMDTFNSLLRERETIRNELATWWQKWETVYRREIGDGDPAAAVFPIDEWARESSLETAKRCALKANVEIEE